MKTVTSLLLFVYQVFKFCLNSSTCNCQFTCSQYLQYSVATNVSMYCGICRQCCTNLHKNKCKL